MSVMHVLKLNRFSSKVVNRPLELSQSTLNDVDVSIHAYVSSLKIHGAIDSLTIFLVNTLMTSHKDID